MKLTADLHLVLRLRVSGAVPALCHMPGWYTQGQLNLCIILLNYGGSHILYFLTSFTLFLQAT